MGSVKGSYCNADGRIFVLFQMKPAELSKLMGDFQSEGYKQSVETRLLAYLSYNYYHLPMYAKPGMV